MTHEADKRGTSITPRHHVDDDMLLAYAAGSLSEAASLVVVAHLTFCPRCRARVLAAEAVGGALLDTVEPEDVAPLPMDSLDAAAETPPAAETNPPSLFGAVLPRALAAYMPENAKDVRWNFVQPGVRFAELFKDASGARVGLMYMRQGNGITPHGHTGDELAVVLRGGYRDGAMSLQRGDAQIADENVVHAPLTDDEDCLALVMIRGAIRPTKLLARLLRPLTGF